MSQLTIDAKGRAHQADPVDRPVTFQPPGGPYDPRDLIEGAPNPLTGDWESGLFDRHSFVEMLGGWARTVVTGRARLGGIPVGVIAVETRPVEVTHPADPANVDTDAQVWTIQKKKKKTQEEEIKERKEKKK